jgi:hypothetical protein
VLCWLRLRFTAGTPVTIVIIPLIPIVTDLRPLRDRSARLKASSMLRQP